MRVQTTGKPGSGAHKLRAFGVRYRAKWVRVLGMRMHAQARAVLHSPARVPSCQVLR